MCKESRIVTFFDDLLPNHLPYKTSNGIRYFVRASPYIDLSKRKMQIWFYHYS